MPTMGDNLQGCAYSNFQVNRLRGGGARPCTPTTDVVQIDENWCKDDGLCLDLMNIL